tara:strand:- start:555 stop:764 length:210 start_codon:yes stop_codon:yes gene_type:complete
MSFSQKTSTISCHALEGRIDLEDASVNQTSKDSEVSEEEKKKGTLNPFRAYFRVTAHLPLLTGKRDGIR